MTPAPRIAAVRELRTFGLTMLVAFCAFGGGLWYRYPLPAPADGLSRPALLAILLAALGVGICGICFVWPTGGRHIYTIWMRFARVLGAIMTPVLFSILYFVLLPPFALLRFRDPLRKRLDGRSYWEEFSKHEATLDRCERPF